MLALLNKSQEVFQKNHCFEPLKKLTVNNGKTSTQLYLRGRSLYVTAPILTLYLSDDNTIHKISFDGYTHESEDTLSISIDRINGDHNLERLNEDILRKIDHKRYQNHSKSYRYWNKRLNIGQRIIFDAQNNLNTPYYLSWITDRQSVNCELLNNIVLPGFIYLRVSSKSQITPIGLMNFKDKDQLQNLFNSTNKPGYK